jgi:8-oxo-dGTP pyrophosphatase MutT (NUDIX family)
VDLADLSGRIAAALRADLPGPAAQQRLAPRPRPGWKPGRLPGASRAGAALLLLYGPGATLVLTLRARHLPSHRGQVSLPGGAVEPGETAETAALREASEEVGVDPAAVRLLGRLTPLHIPASGFVLQPVVGVVEARPALTPAPGEVERILEIPLAALVDPACVVVEPWPLRGEVCQVPYFHLDGERVWGATAMVLSEFLCALGAPPDPWR